MPEKICAYQSEEQTNQDVADALQGQLQKIIGLDSPTEEMMARHAFIVEKKDGLDYMWGTEEKRTLLMSVRPLVVTEGVRIITNE
ncbi:hypothetical protein LCGC14_0358110 [marine sediment metagenome]|uniref:Uncharacterized protein n=1 Tax=marine sediment metagenome TaxID=412755 RepID=A0A0F9T8X1_9ZZZZ